MTFVSSNLKRHINEQKLDFNTSIIVWSSILILHLNVHFWGEKGNLSDKSGISWLDCPNPFSHQEVEAGNGWSLQPTTTGYHLHRLSSSINLHLLTKQHDVTINFMHSLNGLQRGVVCSQYVFPVLFHLLNMSASFLEIS